ncbi:MAG TPA: hypothetical protein VF646_15695 [Cytophagales bacterium]
MPTTIRLYCLLLAGLLAACRPDDTPLRQPASVTGHWRSTGTTRLFYTDGLLTDREATGGAPRETYHFAKDGTGVLRQGDDSFAVRGRWQYDAGRRALTLLTTGGETLRWTVVDNSPTRLVLAQVREISFHGHTQRLEARTELVIE